MSALIHMAVFASVSEPIHSLFARRDGLLRSTAAASRGWVEAAKAVAMPPRHSEGRGRDGYVQKAYRCIGEKRSDTSPFEEIRTVIIASFGAEVPPVLPCLFQEGFPHRQLAAPLQPANARLGVALLHDMREATHDAFASLARARTALLQWSA